MNRILGIITLVAVSPGFSNAAEPDQETAASLSRERTQTREMVLASQDNYRTEMQNRLQSMSPSERELFRSMNELDRQRNNDAGGNGGSHGKGKGNRRGQGGGSGKIHRYGQDENQGYGMGYEARQNGGYGGGKHGRSGSARF